MDAAQALRELTEVSSQIQGAVLLQPGGGLLASTLDDEAATERFVRALSALAEAADRVPPASADQPLVQLQVSLAQGSVFLVRDGERIAGAVTSPEPTAGLVFYDLKSCLRAAAAEEGDGRPRPRARSRSSEGDEGAA